MATRPAGTIVAAYQRELLERWVAAYGKPQSLMARALVVMLAATPTQQSRSPASYPPVARRRLCGARYQAGGPVALAEVRPDLFRRIPKR